MRHQTAPSYSLRRQCPSLRPKFLWRKAPSPGAMPLGTVQNLWMIRSGKLQAHDETPRMRRSQNGQKIPAILRRRAWSSDVVRVDARSHKTIMNKYKQDII